MGEDFVRDRGPKELDLKKYRVAGYGFLVLNVIYALIALWKLPPVDATMASVAYGFLFTIIVLAVALPPFILRGNRLLVIILAIVFGGRGIFSIYSLAVGGAFPAVPYLLPCLILTCYLLGRAAWDWP